MSARNQIGRYVFPLLPRLVSSCVSDPSFKPEIGRAQGTTAMAQDRALVAPDQQDCLSSDDLDLVRMFFELLAKWEDQDHRGN
jgi:hypothetical protein